MYSRREFGKIALAGLPAATALAQTRPLDSKIAGVQIGIQTYSLRDLPLDRAIAAIAEIGLGECELYAPHVEPPPPARTPGQSPAEREAARKTAREALRNWRLTVSLDDFRMVRQKFHNAGIRIYAYNYSFVDDFTDDEIDRGFQMTKALGANIITASSTLTTAKRVVPFAEKYNMTVAYHGHSDVRDPNQFAKPESFAAALAMSRHFAVNLDIGHFVAANYDPIQYIQAHHDRIVILHLKDRKRDEGPNVPWGQGDTPIKAVLQLLRDQRWPIRAYIEYEYRGASDSPTEVKKCFEYCKQALA
jgi:sugar phosphate isomerase/epimerase